MRETHEAVVARTVVVASGVTQPRAGAAARGSERPLHGDGFEDVRPRREGCCAHQAEAGLIEQLCELCLGALATTAYASMIKSSGVAESMGPLGAMRSGRRRASPGTRKWSTQPHDVRRNARIRSRA